MSLFLLLNACNESNLNKGVPTLEVEPTSIDFGEVVVSWQETLGVAVRNTGYGTLKFEGFDFADGSSPDFEVTEWPEDGLGHGVEGVLAVRYTPDVEGGDAGTLLVTTSIEGDEPAQIPLEGIGVSPCIDLDPEALYFGTVAPGDSVTREVHVGADCSGTLKVAHTAFAGDEAVAYSLGLPDDYAEPFPVSSGYSYTMEVTFTPPDESAYTGEIWIESNDAESPVAIVRLYGNTGDDPDLPTAPTVEILSPDNGEYFMDDAVASFTGYASDPDEPVSNLVCAWYADGTRIDGGFPDDDGNIAGSGVLPVGSVELTLRCYDSAGESGEDTVVLDVFDAEEPLLYTISGGESVYDYFTVDDDVSIYVNGSAVFQDEDHTKGSVAPVEFEAARGDTIRIVAVDHNYCEAVLDALVLHWGTGDSQPLNDAVCSSACDGASCYDGGYNGPWPGTFLDESYTIAIP